MKYLIIVHDFVAEKKMKCCGMSMTTLVTHMWVADELRKKESACLMVESCVTNE